MILSYVNTPTLAHILKYVVAKRRSLRLWRFQMNEKKKDDEFILRHPSSLLFSYKF